MTQTNPLGRLIQLGLVVPNLDAAIATMTQKFGTGRFMPLPPNPHEVWFRGRMEMSNYQLAFGYIGEMNVELIMPILGANVYSEYLARVPAGGIHHLGYQVEDFDAAAAEMEARGFSPVQKGSFGDTRFHYYEAQDAPGIMSEILYLDPAVQGMFGSIKAQTF